MEVIVRFPLIPIDFINRDAGMTEELIRGDDMDIVASYRLLHSQASGCHSLMLLKACLPSGRESYGGHCKIPANPD
jgi:hypothetical protein